MIVFSMLEHNVSFPAPNCKEYHYFKIGDCNSNKHLLSSFSVLGVVLNCLSLINPVFMIILKRVLSSIIIKDTKVQNSNI